jgi:hypothetical protein
MSISSEVTTENSVQWPGHMDAKGSRNNDIDIKGKTNITTRSQAKAGTPA